MPRMAGSKDTIIVDLDGTLALDNHRNHHLHGPNGKRDWDTYFSLCHLDAPNIPVIELCRTLFRAEFNIQILTGRNETTGVKTAQWLVDHGVPHHGIRMRGAGDRTDDHSLKIGWGNDLGGPDRVLFCVEDRKRVVRAWRLAGYTVLQCAEGDF